MEQKKRGQHFFKIQINTKNSFLLLPDLRSWITKAKPATFFLYMCEAMKSAELNEYHLVLGVGSKLYYDKNGMSQKDSLTLHLPVGSRNEQSYLPQIWSLP
jgi:hypothetical protein